MKVSELAERVGTTATTVRFYEAEGVLPAPPRQGNGYRDYCEDDVARLRLVVALRGLGLDLAECGRLAQLCVTGRCEEMAGDLTAAVANRRAEVAAARAELRHLDDELAALERTLATGAPQTTLCLGAEAMTTTGTTPREEQSTMTSYRITPADTGIKVELTGVGEGQQQLLAAFSDCQAGQCTCPTAEYEKVAAMDVQPSDDAIAITLQAKPGTRFDTDQIAACLDYTVEHAAGESPAGPATAPAATR